MRCDFCGYEFDQACIAASCSSCPLVKNCAKIICPRCGYEMLPESKLVGWVRKIFQKNPLESRPISPERNK